jgi:hypothetical protein
MKAIGITHPFQIFSIIFGFQINFQRNKQTLPTE